MKRVKQVQKILTCCMNHKNSFLPALCAALAVHILAMPILKWQGWTCPARLLAETAAEAGVAVTFINIEEAAELVDLKPTEQSLQPEPINDETLPLLPDFDKFETEAATPDISIEEQAEIQAQDNNHELQHSPQDPSLSEKQFFPAKAKRPTTPSESPRQLIKNALQTKAEKHTGGSNSSGPGFIDTEPILITNPKPPYPPDARKLGVEGSVLLRVKIDASGRVTLATVLNSSGRQDFDLAAVNTVMSKWKFRPAKTAGIAVPCERTISVEFRLR